jgi:hypothetical protein
MGASTPKVFNSQIRIEGEFPCNWDKDVLNKEPMFYKSHISFVREHAGPVTKAFLDAIPSGWDDSIIDSRVHMLMNGWYPAIPGYHHDDVPRPPVAEGAHFLTAGQPDYDTTSYFSEHLLGLVNAEICPTEFAIGECMMPAIPRGELIYREWHNEVMRLLHLGELEKVHAKSGQIIYFDWQTFHQGTKAIGSGWRWFIRLTRNSDTVKSPKNEIRRQVQVYLEFPMEGW